MLQEATGPTSQLSAGTVDHSMVNLNPVHTASTLKWKEAHIIQVLLKTHKSSVN